MQLPELIKRPTIVLVLFLILGFLLRILFFESTSFGYDQARDAFQAISIITQHHLKIIGPTTDIKGLFHGPIFWYLIAPFYYFSGGNPQAARLLMIGMNLVNVVFIYYFAKKMFKDEKVALVSSFLFAVSFEAIQYARWISNPPPAIFFIALFFFGLWQVSEKKSWGLPLMTLALSFAVNFQLFLFYQVLFLIGAFLYLFFTHRTVLVKDFKRNRWLYILSLLVLSPFAIAQVKFKFLGVHAVLSFLTKGKESSEPLFPKLINFFNNKLIANIAFNLTGHNMQVAVMLLIGLVGFLVYWLFMKKKYRKELLLLFVWLLSPVLIYAFEKNDSYFLNIGNIYPLILLTSFFVVYISQKLHRVGLLFLIFIVSLIAYLNISLVMASNRNGETLFSVQYKQTLNDEKKVIDYIYGESGKKAFAINSVTNPLYVNSTWAYLFDWYGRKKFGYMPVWLGYPLDDVGRDIKFSHFNGEQQDNLLYLIIEPVGGIPIHYVNGYIEYENTRSKILIETKIGNFIVQKRVLVNNNGFVREDLEAHLYGGVLHR